MIARHGDRIAAAIFLARTHVTSDFQRQSCVTDPNFWVDPLELAGCRNRPGGNVAPDADAHGLLSPQQNRAPGHGNNRTDRRVQSHHPIQDAWARRNVPGYDSNQAPAILLPSSSGMSHAQISAAQRAYRRQYGFGTDIRTEFNEAVRQMRAAGVPEARIRYQPRLLVFRQSWSILDDGCHAASPSV